MDCVASALSAEALAVLTGLLNIDVRRRLTTSDLMTHRFFADMPWEGMRAAEPPFVPEPQDLASYFPEEVSGSEASAACSFDETHVPSGRSCSHDEDESSDEAISEDSSFTGVRGMHINHLVEFSRIASGPSVLNRMDLLHRT